MKKKFNFSFITGFFVFLFCALLGVTSGGTLMAAGVQTQTSAGNYVQKGDPQTPSNEVQGATIEDPGRANANLPENTIDQFITKIRPCLTPLDTLLRSAGKKTTDSLKFEYWSAGVSPVSCKASAWAQDGSAASGSTYKGGQLTVANAGLFATTDTIMVHYLEVVTSGGTTTETEKDIVFYVVKVDASASKLYVMYGEGDVPATATMIVQRAASEGVTAWDNSCVWKMGRAAADGEKQTVNYSAFPTDSYNYCQIFKWQVAATTLEQKQPTRVKWTNADMEEMATYEFKMAQEASFIFGRRTIYWDYEKSMKIYATGGVVNSITKSFEFKTARGLKEVVDLSKYVFCGNVGNRKRIMFMGSDFNAELSKMLISNSQRNIAVTETREIAGIEFEDLKTNFGHLYCMQHDLLDMYGYKDKAIILDVDNLDRYVCMEKMDTIPAANNPKFEGDIKIYTEAAGVAVRYPDTHCIVTLNTSASA